MQTTDGELRQVRIPGSHRSDTISEYGRKGAFPELRHDVFIYEKREFSTKTFEECLEIVVHQNGMGALWVIWIEKVDMAGGRLI